MCGTDRVVLVEAGIKAAQGIPCLEKRRHLRSQTWCSILEHSTSIRVCACVGTSETSVRGLRKKRAVVVIRRKVVRSGIVRPMGF